MKTIRQRLSHAMNHNKRFCMNEQVKLSKDAYNHVKSLEEEIIMLKDELKRLEYELI